MVSVVGVGRMAGEVTGDSQALGLQDTRQVVAVLLSLLASLNMALFVFNLIPLPPLDGGHIVGASMRVPGERSLACVARRTRGLPIRPPGSLDVGCGRCAGRHECHFDRRGHREAGVSWLISLDKGGRAPADESESDHACVVRVGRMRTVRDNESVSEINLGMPGIAASPFPRKQTRRIMVGDVPVGGGAPISVQSMTTTKTHDIGATLQQIAELTAAGCDIVRVACPTDKDADALAIIAQQSRIPVIADIHFKPKYVFQAIEAGCGAVRVNPGNSGSRRSVKTSARPPPITGCRCASASTPVRWTRACLRSTAARRPRLWLSPRSGRLPL